MVLVVGEGYIEGLEEFMGSYHSLFPGIIWTGLNIDYPGHSFSHLGLFYGASVLADTRHFGAENLLIYCRRGQRPTAEPGRVQHGRSCRTVRRWGTDTRPRHRL